jgi:hypothetical protein
VGAALDVFEGLFVRRDQAGAGAALDRHVADGHPAFHRQRADRLAAIFDDMAGAAGGAGLADHRQGDVLGRDAGAQRPVISTFMFLDFFLDQRLGGQHMLHLGRADAVRQRAEGAVRGGMAVAADDGHAGQRPALFGADDMDDALPDVVTPGSSGCRNRAAFLSSASTWMRLSSLSMPVAVPRGGHVVVGHGDGAFRRAHLAAGHAQPLERLRAGHLVDEVAVDIEQAGAVIGLVGDMGIPDLVVEGLGARSKTTRPRTSCRSTCAGVPPWPITW